MTYTSARIHSLNAQVAGLVVEVEAMNASNLERERQGKAPAYGEEAYQQKANEILRLAQDIRILAEHL